MALTEHREIEARLLKSEGGVGADLFLSPDERLAKAYRQRAYKVAYTDQYHGFEAEANAG